MYGNVIACFAARLARWTDMPLILQTLETIKERLNESLTNAAYRPDPWVILSNVVDHDGRVYEEAKDKIVMYLANLSHETTISTFSGAAPARNTQFAVISPPLYINLFVLFFANFEGKKYPEGLGAISRTISFFQETPTFTHQNLPGLPEEVDKLAFEFVNLDMTALNYLMTLVGTKYLPSVLYKARLIPFQSDAMKAVVPAVKGLDEPSEPAKTAPDVTELSKTTKETAGADE